MNNGTSFKNASDATSINFANGYDFTFDVNNGQNVYMAFYGIDQSALNDPHFTVAI